MAKERKPSSIPTASQEAAVFQDVDYHDRVALRAYELYLARGGSDGADFDDWLAAEREVSGGNGGAHEEDSGE